jgi:nitroimidazol reductase NimA-like FMN-containing flavoprotein (pyridoxamine 5'-phosphate oxidase superfamily)
MRDIPFAEMRREDRAVKDAAWIRAMLSKAPTGVLAMLSHDWPYAKTNLFAFDEEEGDIYLHMASEGRALSALQADGRVCFTVSEMGRLLPGDKARGMSVEFASVVAFGRAEMLRESDEMRRGLQLLMDKYFPHLKPGKDYPALQSQDLEDVAVFRIHIDAWSGKRKVAAADFPGAFFYPAPGGKLS